METNRTTLYIPSDALFQTRQFTPIYATYNISNKMFCFPTEMYAADPKETKQWQSLCTHKYEHKHLPRRQHAISHVSREEQKHTLLWVALASSPKEQRALAVCLLVLSPHLCISPVKVSSNISYASHLLWMISFSALMFLPGIHHHFNFQCSWVGSVSIAISLLSI